MKFGRLCFLALGAALLLACSELPDGTIVMNEETIENFFEGGALKSWDPPMQLNLLMSQPVVAAEIPPVPPGARRIYGTLASAGPYEFPGVPAYAAGRGSSFHDSVYGELGPAGQDGNAWFYADINPESGEIAQARAYLYGFRGGVCDLRQPRQPARLAPFALAIAGYCAFPNQQGAAYRYELVIAGPQNLAAEAPAARFQARYIVDDSGKLAAIPADPRQNPEIYDYGSVSAQIR